MRLSKGEEREQKADGDASDESRSGGEGRAKELGKNLLEKEEHRTHVTPQPLKGGEKDSIIPIKHESI